MNILFIVKNIISSHGGFYRIKKLADKGHNIYIVTSSVEEKYENMNIKIFQSKPFLEFKNFSFPLSYPVNQITNVIEEYDIDVIHCLGLQSTIAFSSVMASRRTKVPLIISLQGLSKTTGSHLLDTFSKLYDRIFSRKMISLADFLILVSESLSDRYERLGGVEEKKVVINPGIDICVFDPDTEKIPRPYPPDCTVIGFTGRFTKIKGVLDLVDSLKYLHEKKIHLLLVGDGPLKEEVMKRKIRYNLPITCTGWVDDTSQFYSFMDIFVLPSYSEGLSRAVLEAMAMKKPIIATRVGGIQELVEEGYNGLFIEQNNPRDISDKIKYCISNKAIIHNWGDRSREIITRKYSIDQEIDKLEKIYHSVITRWCSS